MSNGTNISNVSKDTGSGESLLTEKNEVFSRKYFLKGKTIGISISESDNLLELGFGVIHLKDAIIEIARYLLFSGGKLAYGGDMRQGGFTELIFELLAYYNASKELPPNERFFSYLSYPISTTLSKEKEAELIQNVSFIKVDPPGDLNVVDTGKFIKPDNEENLYIWTRSLSKMREEMEQNIDARILIGGRTKDFKGKCPGILEEFMIAASKSHPIYLVGAFGGITNEIIKALNGEKSKVFSNEYYDGIYMQMVALYNEKHKDDKIDYESYYSQINNLGIEGLAKLNGLSPEENMRLATTPHLAEIIFLIMKGIANRFIKQ